MSNEEIIGKKYTKIEFVESTKEFIVTTEENKVGIITADGRTKVNPQYDALKQIDKVTEEKMGAYTKGMPGLF